VRGAREGLIVKAADAIPGKIVDLCRFIHEGGLRGAGDLDTEWLGDLYQQHNEDARKGRALVQTPGFVRSFILDRTLGEVLRTRGPTAARTIDPTCGCGFFLTDAFRQTYSAWMGLPDDDLHRILVASGGYDPRDPKEAVLAQIALDQVVGVDLDPACVAISRLRLLLEAWAVSDVRMPYRIGVFEGDALLHGRPLPGDDEKYGPWPYDADAVRRALAPGRYTAVVGNPPYITCKDPIMNQAYRDRYPTCHRKFSLAVPFTELFWGLAAREEEEERPGSTPARRSVREHQGVLFVGAES
jgi:hypothetical protein